MDAATLAATFQLKEQRREFVYSFFVLLMKSGFLAVAFISLLKLGLASHHRIERHAEITSILNVEIEKLSGLQKRLINCL